MNRARRVASVHGRRHKVPLPDGALRWRLLKKSKNSQCLCGLAFLQGGVKIVARRASPVTDAAAHIPVCLQNGTFRRRLRHSARREHARKGSHSVSSGTPILDKIIVFTHTIFDACICLGSSSFLSVRFQILYVHSTYQIRLVQ